MVFCNEETCEVLEAIGIGHNPYFNRWFSAMGEYSKVSENY